MPDEMVTIKNECYRTISPNPITARRQGTHDNLEDEEPRHQTQLEPRPLRDALEARERAQDDGEQHHEHGEQHGGEYALDDADDGVRQRAEPREPLLLLAQGVDVRDDTDEGDCRARLRVSMYAPVKEDRTREGGAGRRTRERPQDDQPRRQRVAHQHPHLALIRVHAQVPPDHVLGRDVRVAVRHAVRLVVVQRALREVRADLRVERDERGVERGVRLRGRELLLLRRFLALVFLVDLRLVGVVVSSMGGAPVVLGRGGEPLRIDDRSPPAQHLLRLDDLLPRPVDRVHLLPHERQRERHEPQREAVRRALLLRDELLRQGRIVLRVRVLVRLDVGVRGGVGGRGLGGERAPLGFGGGLGLLLELLGADLGGGLEERVFGGLELGAGARAAVVCVWELFQVAGKMWRWVRL